MCVCFIYYLYILKGLVVLNNNVDISKLLETLSKMDKKQLQEGIAKANQILKNNNKDDILKQINGNK